MLMLNTILVSCTTMAKAFLKTMQKLLSGIDWLLNKDMICSIQSWFHVRNGYGVPQDYAEAVKWYRLAAEQGYARAQYNLGVMYDNGRGVLKTSKEAVSGID